MSTLHEASFNLDRMLIERLREGRPAQIEQIDAVLCEDAKTIMCYVYFSGASEDDCVILSYDWPARPQDFDRDDAARRLLCDDAETVH